MHMADALVSPEVGGALWVISGGWVAVCARKARQALRDGNVPLMGVLGAFVFAAQMINFTIPGTGSSGHLGGGLLLSVLLGPWAAFLVMASVLAVQAFFFADGGLLALGCNIFNLGFFPAFVAYPLLYRPTAGGHHGTGRAWLAAVTAAVAALQLGAVSVVLETRLSGISALPFGLFALVMLPIHLAIGVVEGMATAAVIAFVARVRPEGVPAGAAGQIRPRMVLGGLALAAALVGGVASWFASTHPDGLEWSIARITGREDLEAAETGIRRTLAGVQDRTAILPDYGCKPPAAAAGRAAPGQEPWPAVSGGTSLAGIVGGLLTLVLVCLIGAVLNRRWRGDAARVGILSGEP